VFLKKFFIQDAFNTPVGVFLPNKTTYFDLPVLWAGLYSCSFTEDNSNIQLVFQFLDTDINH